MWSFNVPGAGLMLVAPQTMSYRCRQPAEVGHLDPPRTRAARGPSSRAPTPVDAQARLRTVLTHAPLALFSFDERGIITLFEGRGLEALGLKPGERVGRSVFHVFAAYPCVTENARHALEGRAVTTVGQMPEGWLEARYIPLRDPAGKVTGALATCIDITARQRALDALDQQQAVLKYVIANVPHAIFWKDRQGRFLGGNQNFLNDTHTRVLENLLGKTDFDVWGTGEDAAAFVKIDREVMERGVPMLDIEEPLLRPDGQRRVLLTSKVPIRDESGEVTGLLGIYADITERKQMELDLHKAKEAADAAARAKGEFLTMMSHELRTPLSLILGPLESLLSSPDEPLSPKVRTHLERIQRSGRRLHRLVDDVLDYQKIEAGKMLLDWEAVDVTTLVADLVEEARPAAERGLLQLALEVDPALGTVPLDRRKFEKIALNLLGNALKFTPPGGRVTVGLRPRDGVVELCVEDTGPGIPSDKMHLLFQRFQQIDASMTRKHEGTGIGLSLVKELTELMGGTLGVESEPGVGSRFFVRLPRAAGPRIAPPPPGSPARTSANGAPASAGDFEQPELRAMGASGAGVRRTEPAPRLLVVEDNPDMRSYIEDILLAEYEIALATNGREALEAVKASRPDVIVSDVMMPEMDGFELVRRLKREPGLRSIPIILLTAKASRAETVGGLEVGADDYLVKPFDPLELKARVRAAERLHRAYQELEAKNIELATALKRLSETQEELVQAGKMAAIGTLVAGLSHELNNPVAIILMNAQLVLKRQRDGHGMPDERLLLKVLRTIEQQAHRCSDLTRALLDYSRGKTIGRETCDMSTALRRAYELSTPRARGRAVHLKVNSSTAAPLPTVLVNPAQLDSALLNVIGNAIDATPRGGTVEVEAHPLRHRDIEGVQIEVHDTGSGIRPEHLDRLFEPFFTTKPPGKGTGLGLSLTHRFIQENGGDIRVESELGAGTTIRMWLPASHVQGRDGDTP
ncbi:ATP-binding protein [Sorangium sp. So ce295]|uniref:ATP-binding protein n=1 Tax=Sorangium sp. So ce295 TaxID=3133295 RepID=UPI003F628A56